MCNLIFGDLDGILRVKKTELELFAANVAVRLHTDVHDQNLHDLWRLVRNRLLHSWKLSGARDVAGCDTIA